MQLISTITQCNNCQSLKELIDKIECSLYLLLRNEQNNLKFNTELYFSTEHVKTLSHYKRILNARIFNPIYPDSGVKSQDLIARVNNLLYGDSTNCSRCLDCYEPITTTTSTSTTSTSTSSSTSTTTSTTTTTTTTILL